jgi:hypothetical protein
MSRGTDSCLRYTMKITWIQTFSYKNDLDPSQFERKMTWIQTNLKEK